MINYTERIRGLENTVEYLRDKIGRLENKVERLSAENIVLRKAAGEAKVEELMGTPIEGLTSRAIKALLTPVKAMKGMPVRAVHICIEAAYKGDFEEVNYDTEICFYHIVTMSEKRFASVRNNGVKTQRFMKKLLEENDLHFGMDKELVAQVVLQYRQQEEEL